MSLKASRGNAHVSTTGKENPLEFQVVPDVGLKNENIQFLLGMPLNQVVTLIQQNARLLQKIQLTYSKKEPFRRDVCIYLSADGIKLFFEASNQLLRLIEVDNLSRIVLKYGKTVFSEPGAEASMEKVNEYFGSTHPGAYDERQKMYVQSWPGLSFCFPTDSSGNIEVAPGFGPNLRSLKYDVTSQPRLTKMSIYKGTTLSRPEPVDVPLDCYGGQNRTQLVECLWKDDKIVGLNITFETQTGAKIDGKFEITSMTRSLRFGDTVAAVQAILGAPSKVFYKSEDKMSIHRGAKKETLRRMPHFFFNYFSMGLIWPLLLIIGNFAGATDAPPLTASAARFTAPSTSVGISSLDFFY
ncbi:unnamed protein product [Caenorhabditis auriculariae]|uniref:Uncharacterized protein n=1 Tax=Caenorhabditis auriculariae TaxID=2777116 RepID=A0A8S1GRR7_9PELO|nr:unnamed protein product [Caenorhabditis auriculariae]